MNINYNYYNKQILINQLVEQTKFNLARLTSLENIVNKLVNTNVVTLDEALDKLVNGYRIFSNTRNIKSNSSLSNLININITKIPFDKNIIEKIKLPNINIFEYVEESSNFFSNSSTLEEIYLNSEKFENITNTSNMFGICPNLKYIDLSSATFKNVTNTSSMFASTNKLISIDVSSATFENVTNAFNMFCVSQLLQYIDLSSATFKNVTNVSAMFGDCGSLTTLYLPNATFENVTNTSYMFSGCNNLTTIYITKQGFDKIQSVLPSGGTWTTKQVEGKDYIVATKQKQTDP